MQILAKDRLTRPILCEQLPDPRLRSALTVFIVEGSRIPLPLSECTRRLALLFPKGRFIMVDRTQSDEEIIRLTKLGFHGFVEHSEVVSSLATAVRTVATGGTHILPDIMQRQLYLTTEAGRRADAAQSTEHRYSTVPTPRENEILELIRLRLSNKEIAATLKLAEKTVKFHVSNILAKFGVESRRDLEINTSDSAGVWEELSKVRTF